MKVAAVWRSVERVLHRALRSASPPRTRPHGRRTTGQNVAAAYPGDYAGPVTIHYTPHPDGVADPGEIVWTWVPYEEDHSQGKDRPVVIIGRDDGWLLALPLTSKDHDLDTAQEAAQGRFWLEIGTGAWDRSGRVSEVRLNRIVRVAPTAVRRVAGRLDAARFQQVADGVRRYYR